MAEYCSRGAQKRTRMTVVTKQERRLQVRTEVQSTKPYDAQPEWEGVLINR